MKAKIVNGVLVLEVPLQTPSPSSTGKTLVVASTRGFTALPVQIEGKPVSLSLNAFISKS